MRDKALHIRHDGRPVEHARELLFELSAHDGDTVLRDRARGVAIAHRQRPLQEVVHVAGNAGVRMILVQFSRPAEEMRHTRLMQGLRKLPIGRPPIADQDAPEIGAQHAGRLLESAPRQNGVDGRVRRGKDPQPVQRSVDAPARFIGDHHRAGLHRLTERRVRGLRLRRDPMDRAHQGAPRHRQAEAIREHRLDLAERQSELLIETRRDGQGLRAELHGRRADGVGGLERMAALQAAAASTTPTDVHIESAHHRPHRRQILLILRRHMGVVDRSTALRAGRGHRHVLHVIDERGGRPLAVTPMRRSRPASRSARMGRTHAFREGGGLTKPRAARGLQLAAQPLDLAAQPIALTLGPFEIEAQSFILVQHLFDRRAPGGHPVGGITHAPVMPESARRYKSDPVINWVRLHCIDAKGHKPRSFHHPQPRTIRLPT